MTAKWNHHIGFHCCAFNDIHAVMAFVASGQLETADGMIQSMKQYAEECLSQPPLQALQLAAHLRTPFSSLPLTSSGVVYDNAFLTSAVAVPLCEGLVAYRTV